LRGGLNNGNRSESSSSYHSDQNAVKSSKAPAVAQQGRFITPHIPVYFQILLIFDCVLHKDPSSSHGEYYPHNLHRTQAGIPFQFPHNFIFF
jgi:hypothetical protein